MKNLQAHPNPKTRVARSPRAASDKSTVRAPRARKNMVKNAARAEMTTEERHQKIAEAAYYRALQRGFHGGSDIEDWLEAEAEIDKLMFHG